jgi:predicted glutamine amidotransferase
MHCVTKKTAFTMVTAILLVANAAAFGGGLFQADDVPVNPSHNCRFWGMLATRAFDDTTMRNHLEYLQVQLAPANYNGWGIGFYAQTIQGERIPVIYRGRWRADQDCRYDSAANVMIRNLSHVGVAHIRLASAGYVYIPNPHPFYTQGLHRDFDMLFAHNGTLNIPMLQNLVGAYADTNRYDYAASGSPNNDSDLYRLYLMKWIDGHPGDGITKCLTDALNNLISQMGRSLSYNFVLASRCDTLWALRYNNTLSYRCEVGSPNVWEVASEPLGGSDWVQATDHSLYVFIPDQSVPTVIGLNNLAVPGSPGDQPHGAAESNAFRLFYNPSDKTLTVEFGMDDERPVFVKMYDISGRLVDRIYQNTARKGTNRFSYDMSHLPSGAYFVRLEAGDRKVTRKLVVAR